MSRPATDLLEFPRLREIVRGFTTCAPGRRAIEALAPSLERERLEGEFALVREAMGSVRVGKQLGFGALADPEPWLARLGPANAEVAAATSVLTPMELLDVATLLDTAGWLREYFRDSDPACPGLEARTELLGDFRVAATAIRRTVLPDGTISDDASPELRRIRATLSRTRDGIQKTLREILRSRGSEAGEDYVTLRNDRYVIPVRAADRHQGSVRDAIVHGASATGQTVFVEPIVAVEMNNRLVQLAEDEAAEIARILAALTDLLRGQAGPLRFAAQTIAEMDSIFARARYAREYDCALPKFCYGDATEAGRRAASGARSAAARRRVERGADDAGVGRCGNRAGDQRSEHGRKERGAEDRGPGGARGAIGNSGAGAIRRIAAL